MVRHVPVEVLHVEPRRAYAGPMLEPEPLSEDERRVRNTPGLIELIEEIARRPSSECRPYELKKPRCRTTESGV